MRSPFIGGAVRRWPAAPAPGYLDHAGRRRHTGRGARGGAL